MSFLPARVYLPSTVQTPRSSVARMGKGNGVQNLMNDGIGIFGRLTGFIAVFCLLFLTVRPLGSPLFFPQLKSAHAKRQRRYRDAYDDDRKKHRVTERSAHAFPLPGLTALTALTARPPARPPGWPC